MERVDRRCTEKLNADRQLCNVGLSREEVAVWRSDLKRMKHAVFGDGNGNRGMMALSERREGQLALLLWIFGPCSILGLGVSILGLILRR